MTKIDYEGGKKAVENIVENSAKVEKILTTIADLNKQLGDATNEYEKLNENLVNLNKNLPTTLMNNLKIYQKSSLNQLKLIWQRDFPKYRFD